MKKVGKPQERAERLLIAEARTGSPEAFADLVKIYSPRIYNISLKILRHPADAEDNVQNVLWKAHPAYVASRGARAFLHGSLESR